MSDKYAQLICGAVCHCWRRCNYCRSSRMEWDMDTEFAVFTCRNTEYPMCHGGEGFECIFLYNKDTCINNASPHYDAEKVKLLEEMD